VEKGKISKKVAVGARAKVSLYQNVDFLGGRHRPEALKSRNYRAIKKEFRKKIFSPKYTKIPPNKIAKIS
jgi:hypothetical protein